MSTTGIDLNDPGISQAYTKLVNEGVLRWILLGYTTKPNQLRLFASGKGDVDEMKEYVKVEDICYGVFSEPSRNRGVRLTVTYIPDIIGGVWRARALVHGKAVAAKFMAHEMVRLSDINQFNVQKFRSALHLPPRVTDYVPSQPVAIDRSASPSPITAPPPRGDSLKQPSTVSRKPVSNKLSPSEDMKADIFSSAEPGTGLLSPPNNSTQLSLFSMMTGTAATENFRLRSETPSPSPGMKLSNLTLSLPSPPEDSDTYASDAILSDAETSSESSRRVDAAQSPIQPFSPGPFQASDSSSEEEEEEEEEEVQEEESEGGEYSHDLHSAIDDNESLDHLEDIQRSLPSTSSAFTKPGTPSGAKLSSVSCDKPLPPIRISALDIIEGLPYSSDSSLPYARSDKSVEGLPISLEQSPKVTIRKSGDSIGGATRSSLPSPPSSPEGFRPSPSIPPVPPIPPQVAIQFEPQSPLQVEPLSASPPQSTQPSTILSAMQSGQKPSSLSTTQLTRQIQPQSQPEPIAENKPSESDTSTSSRLPLYGTFRNNPSAMKYPNARRRLSTAIDEAEERKLAVLEEERRRRTMWLAELEKEEKREQEMRDREFLEKREQERLKRLENARNAEMARAQLKRQQEEEEARKKAEQLRRTEEKLSRQTRVRERINGLGGMLLLSGFVSVLLGTTWRRRYYQLTTEEWKFFKDDEDMGSPLSVLALSRIKAIREWDEGYEELEFMPNGFAVELTDGAPWLFFVDSKEEKDIFSGLLGQAGGQ